MKNRITTLENVILRDEGRGKSDTFIYTVPKVNKVKAYCKLGKLEDVMEHFKIDSIDKLVEILEAWDVCKHKMEIYNTESYVLAKETTTKTSDNTVIKINVVDYYQVQTIMKALVKRHKNE